MAKLNWQYHNDTSEEIATVRDGIRIRAAHDDDASNPFTDGDMNWPIVVRSGGRDTITHYDAGVERKGLDNPIACFTDALLMHWQQRIAIDLGSTVPALIECYGNSEDALPEGKLMCRDAEVLRDAFTQSFDDHAESDQFDLAVKLLAMCDIVAVSTTVTGYSQGDWADVLVIGYPSTIERFGNTSPPTTDDLQHAADLYGWWAWNDVYGYIIERWVPSSEVEPEDFDPDFDEGEWVEIEGGSCWGYYGPDHNKSGLEESALESVPDAEPVLQLEAA